MLLSFVYVLHLIERILQLAGSQDCADRLRCSFGHGKPSRYSHQTLPCGHWGVSAECLTQLFSSLSQYVLVNGCQSNLVNVVLGVPRGNV